MPAAHRRTPAPRPMPIVAALVLIAFAVWPAPAVCQDHSGEAVANATQGDSVEASSSSTPRPRIVVALEKGGEIVIELFPDEAPIAVERITSLVREKFYDGMKFHRVESYLVQTGKKDSDLPPVEGEMFGQSLHHEIGMVGMARLPDDYDSATTQFYIMKERRPRLNGEYTIFGMIVEGMERVMKIKKGWKIESATVVP